MGTPRSTDRKVIIVAWFEAHTLRVLQLDRGCLPRLFISWELARHRDPHSPSE